MLRCLLAAGLLCPSVRAASWVDLGNEIFAGDNGATDYQSVIPLAKAQAVRIEKNGEGCASAALDLQFIGSDPDSGAPIPLKQLLRDGRQSGVDEYTLYPATRVLGLRFRVRRAGSCYFTFSLQESVDGQS